MDEYLEDLEKGEAPTNVWYGVSPTGYENLSVNMSEIKRYLRQMFSIITYYQELNDGQDEEKAD
jgi:C4-dicarboxylate-specific signal transduction histidine kinase